MPNLATLSQATKKAPRRVQWLTHVICLQNKKAPPSASQFASTLNKYPHQGGKQKPLGCREEQGYWNQQKHGKLSSSSCLKHFEGHSDDNSLETQPKQLLVAPDQTRGSRRSFQLLIITTRRHRIECSLGCQQRGLGRGPVQFFPELL